MPEPQDAVLPFLQKIQKDIADFRKSIESKVNDVAENVLEVHETVSNIQRDMLMQLGLTTNTGRILKRFAKKLST